MSRPAMPQRLVTEVCPIINQNPYCCNTAKHKADQHKGMRACVCKPWTLFSDLILVFAVPVKVLNLGCQVQAASSILLILWFEIWRVLPNPFIHCCLGCNLFGFTYIVNWKIHLRWNRRIGPIRPAGTRSCSKHLQSHFSRICISVGFGGFKHVWIIPAPTWDDSRKLQKLQKLQKVQKVQKLQRLSI